MIKKSIMFLILSVGVCSCSIIQSNHNKQDYDGVYKYITYDNFGQTTAGPMLIFQDQNENFIFVLTETDTFIISEENKERLSSIAKNPDYVKLKKKNYYKLKLEVVKDVNYDTTGIATQPTYGTDGFVISNSTYEIIILKNGKINGKVFTCNQIYADYISKFARVTND